MHELLAFWDISKEDSSTGTWNRIPGAITDQRFLKSNQTNTGTFSLGQINQLPHKKKNLPVQHIQRRVCGERGGENQPILTSCPHLWKIGQVLYCPAKNYNKYISQRGSGAFRLFGATYQCRHVIVLPTCQGRHWRHRHKRILGYKGMGWDG